MVSTNQTSMNFKDLIPSTIVWLCIIAQIVLTFTKWNNYYGVDGLYYTGFAVWGLSAIFGILPIIEFRRKGKVAEGASYMKTTFLVTSGIYSIVRHPQYLAGIFISLALVCMSQFWGAILLLVPVIFLTYIDSRKANANLIRKFGDQYMEYMSKVPGLNPIVGIIKLILRSIKKNA
jgi:protein-S-isoprenylcysteine O-methyltransferase Ste14